MNIMRIIPIAMVMLSVTAGISLTAQEAGRPTTAAAGVSVPGDYVIGIEDVLGIVFWREQDKNLTTDVVVRPDGKISVPMLNDIKASGLTAEQLSASVQQAASKYIRDTAVTVVVREIHSRKIFVIGEVAKPGTIQIGGELNVLQAIAEAGGFLEHAKKTNVVIVRNEGGRERRFKFNYKDVVAGKNLTQNIKLLPGDTVLVR
jgi:polysaccharide biosynthesis/export protein